MEMVRSFLPVGQGAFYTEQFADGTNVIYDCGSENGIRMIKEMIKSIFHEGDCKFRPNGANLSLRAV